MGFKDIIKGSVLDGFVSSDLTTLDIAIALGVAVLVGLYIYFLYRVTSKSGFYNRSFNKSLAILPVITTAIMVAMQSNLVISLGMVGALSIVRFRNAVKDSSDLTFLFWSISVGIIVGAGLFELAVLLCLFMTLLVVGLDLLPTVRMPYLLVVSAAAGIDETALMACIKHFCPRAKVRSRNISQRGMEWIIELQIKDGAGLVHRVSNIMGVTAVNLMSHDGEVRF